MFRIASVRLALVIGGTCAPRLSPAIRRVRCSTPLQTGAAVRFVASKNEDDQDFSFDSTELIQREAAVANASSNTERLLQQLLPPGAPDSARTKVANYFREHPVDQLILCSTVQVTHIEDEAGEEKKAGNLSPMPLKDALEAAAARGLQVVQMGEANGKAFVRLRDERKRIMAIIAEDMASVAVESKPSEEADQQVRLKKSIDHAFRDVVDAHFISWKSKKIVEDIKRLHPVKVAIQQFQSAESAIAKLREMTVAIKGHAEAANVIHHFTTINVGDKEISILFSPSAQGKENSAKAIKHPGEKEWANALNRLQGVMRKSGRSGTYSKFDSLKPRNLGAVNYRVDRFGRRMN